MPASCGDPAANGAPCRNVYRQRVSSYRRKRCNSGALPAGETPAVVVCSALGEQNDLPERRDAPVKLYGETDTGDRGSKHRRVAHKPALKAESKTNPAVKRPQLLSGYAKNGRSCLTADARCGALSGRPHSFPLACGSQGGVITLARGRARRSLQDCAGPKTLAGATPACRIDALPGRVQPGQGTDNYRRTAETWRRSARKEARK